MSVLIDPEHFNHTASITITPHEVTVVRFLTNADGKHFIGDDGEPAREESTLLVVASPPEPTD